MLSAPGITSLIKVVLALKNKTIPHTVNYDKSNTNIDFVNSPFYVASGKPTNYTLSDVERKSNSNELANDLKMFS